ncbi:MAG: hypothetical protein JSR99_15450 [Proteobacteria bacterium]|nr:hypothetical protein [Pseudomonadota bacterium]
MNSAASSIVAPDCAKLRLDATDVGFPAFPHRQALLEPAKGMSLPIAGQ